MIVLDGQVALSPFRLERLNQPLAAVQAGRCTAAWFVYFIDAESVPDAEQTARWRAILDGREAEPEAAAFWVVPRLGTISPWSSKATEILTGIGCALQRVERGVAYAMDADDPSARKRSAEAIHDPMTESVLESLEDGAGLFLHGAPGPLGVVALGNDPAAALGKANRELGLALAGDEIAYLAASYAELGRDPTDAELMMFAQANSEHCRHKIFRADWTIDGEAQKRGLFEMIRNTHAVSPEGTLSAYSDNAAVIEGSPAKSFLAGVDGVWQRVDEPSHIAIKVETHNHPTAIAPWPGAATGAGGEIRDEGAVGRGGKPKAGLTGFSVSHLRIPGLPRPWEDERPLPPRFASSFEIMRDGPLGAAAFNNEFGRPALGGYFRTFEVEFGGVLRGYDKPIMIAGGLAAVRPEHVHKCDLQAGDCIVLLGGPAMLIGLGGGAASSMAAGSSSAELDFASVQRENPEMERRCQAVINACIAAGADSPIRSIHDVGAGGLSNAIPELLHDSELGGRIDLDAIPVADSRLSPMQIWCNESQERYVIGVHSDDVAKLAALCERERCPFAVVGEATAEPRLLVGHGVSTQEPSPAAMPSPAASSGEERPLTPTLSPASGGEGANSEATAQPRLLVGHGLHNAGGAKPGHESDNAFNDSRFPIPDSRLVAIDLPMAVLFGNTPTLHREATRIEPRIDLVPDLSGIGLDDAVKRVLRMPVVGSKSFLVTIGDRSVGGLVARDPMVGPWQVPVADCAITLADFDGYAGEAMAMAERSPTALLDSAGAARMALGEVVTNLLAAPIERLADIRLSANWMAAAGHDGDGAALFDAVAALGMELCPELGISIPVGKDSLSMRVEWEAELSEQAALPTPPASTEDPPLSDAAGKGRSSQPSAAILQTVSPVSLVLTGFARVADVRQALTPVMPMDVGHSELWLIDLGGGRDRLGGSALIQAHGRGGGMPPDLDDPARLQALAALVRDARSAGLLLACHDRSDGGLFTTLLEMAFASHAGLVIHLDGWGEASLRALFNEELGLVVQIASANHDALRALLARHGLADCAHRVAEPRRKLGIKLLLGGEVLHKWRWSELFDAWQETSHAMQRLRDNPATSDQERSWRIDDDNPGLQSKLRFDPAEDVAAPYIASGARPKLAILREQGVNGEVEMAAAFDRAGFEAVDVHMTDLAAGRRRLDEFAGLAACGGFSYGDVLGAGRGWAASILYHDELRRQFADFFADGGRIALGVCNGCQMFSHLAEIIPGAGHWPRFVRNTSEQYEARLAMVEIKSSPSIFLAGMEGSRLPVVVAHGEGRAVFAEGSKPGKSGNCIRYVNCRGKPTETFPYNPSGSPAGVTGFQAADGRVLALMPHPERVFRSVQLSWYPPGSGEDSPWMRMFRNARLWVA